MYQRYLIMREPGETARRNRRQWDPYFGPRPKRVAVVEASGPVEALGDFEYQKYLTANHRQYAGGRFQWTTERRYPDGWRNWNGTDDPGTRGREWRLVVTLRNGRNEHEAIFYAWKESER